ncbi:MAG: phospho-N-acetylmuramoyl-pentapeptide-transferase [Clostridia bacterium]|nr:phospho-N-acetylmuramoyl-pentapeptide-transferase [Clostridia bacterium]
MNTVAVPFLVVFAFVFILTASAERILIPILRAKKAGQTILEIGPSWHKAKEGTPIMGGIGFILAIMLAMAGYFIYLATQGRAQSAIPLSVTLAFAIANGAIGFFDDYLKLMKKENEGLTKNQKLFLQLVIATAYVCVLSYTGNLSTALKIPFSDISLDLGWLFYPLAVLFLTGVVNGANFTDGVDGLASSVTLVIGAFFTVVAFAMQNEGLSTVGAALMGAMLGFLIYNFHPAQIFMGDTGSLFLGALVIGTAFMMQEVVIGLVIGAVFIIEMLSSLTQTLYFKLTHGKRLFRMAPLHHHFEKCGWNEYTVVAVFSAAEAVFCLIAYFAL